MTVAEGATKDRIVDAAMRLFGEQGYRATSVTQIERAAGLSPGAGGIYHHFKSKDAVLSAGVARQLNRLAALRDIKRLFGGLGDLRTELTITGRYLLAELDQEAELLRLVLSEARTGPAVLGDAAAELVGGAVDEFADWVEAASGAEVTPGRARAIASIGLGSLISSRLLRDVLGASAEEGEDEALVTEWVAAMEHLITRQPTEPPAREEHK